jgi:hypothetical protein
MMKFIGTLVIAGLMLNPFNYAQKRQVKVTKSGFEKFKCGLIFQNPGKDKRGKEVLKVLPAKGSTDYNAFQTSSHFNYLYLPPVDSQGQQGSCVGWAIGYYLKSYQENRENSRTDLSDRSKLNNICSPAFIYNLIHIKGDNGSYFGDAFQVIHDFGCASWESMPYNDSDYQTWPDESDFIDAIPRRTADPDGSYPGASYGYDYYWLTMDSNDKLNQLKQLLLNGKVVAFGIYVYGNYGSIGNYGNIYTLYDKTGYNSGGHAQVMVGYDDTKATNDGTGAFRVVNSWGTGWGDSGFYWISYEAIKYGSDLSQGYALWVDDRINYSSDKMIRFQFSHYYSRETNVWVEMPGSVISAKSFFDFYARTDDSQYLAYPYTSIVMDIKDWKSYLTDGTSLRLYMQDTLSNGTTGTINAFSYIAGGNQDFSADTPVSVGDGLQAYAALTTADRNIQEYIYHGNNFTGDNKADIAVYRPSNGYWYTRGGSYIRWGIQPGDIPVPGDYNGDGTTGIAVYRPANGYWYIRGVGNYQWGIQTGDVPVPGDYNKDGKTDIAVYRPSNGYWYIKGVGNYRWGIQSGDIPVPGDYNGDNQTDIAVYRPSNGYWYIKGIGNYQWGIQSGDIPVPGDYDGNGTTDIAIYRHSDGYWYIRAGSYIRWGIQSEDIPVQADYNGDGKFEIAVFRPSNGTWYIRGVGNYVWGIQPGDIPVTRGEK